MHRFQADDVTPREQTDIRPVEALLVFETVTEANDAQKYLGLVSVITCSWEQPACPARLPCPHTAFLRFDFCLLAHNLQKTEPQSEDFRFCSWHKRFHHAKQFKAEERTCALRVSPFFPFLLLSHSVYTLSTDLLD